MSDSADVKPGQKFPTRKYESIHRNQSWKPKEPAFF
jgi:hypothetical protein